MLRAYFLFTATGRKKKINGPGYQKKLTFLFGINLKIYRHQKGTQFQKSRLKEAMISQSIGTKEKLDGENRETKVGKI